MPKNSLFFLIIFVGLFLSLLVTNAQNQNPFNITFPIAELGNCGSYDECRNYCDIPANQSACLDYAQKNGLMTSEQAQQAKALIEQTGPGGCRGEECKDYCENPANRSTCMDWAVQNGYMTQEQADLAKKFLEKSRQGGPGGCRGPEECQAYCENPDHQEECFEFAEDLGFVTEEDREEFEVGKKISQVVKEKGGPGGCKTEDECRIYCTNPDNVEECIAFGATHGGIPEEQVRKMLEEFTQHSSEYYHHKSGMSGPVTKEDIKRFKEEAKKRFEEFKQLEHTFRGSESDFQVPPEFKDKQIQFRGPGGCSSPSECIKYCTEHKEECFSFGPPGKPDYIPPEGGIPPGHEDYLRIRKDIQPCPAMPTVDSCPAGQYRYPIYSSPECGTYYGCLTKEGTSTGGEKEYDPAKYCSKKGGRWDGTNCVFPSQEGYKEDPATKCAQYGGSWDGTTCKFPQAPSPSSEVPRAKGFLANILEFFLGGLIGNR